MSPANARRRSVQVLSRRRAHPLSFSLQPLAFSLFLHPSPQPARRSPFGKNFDSSSILWLKWSRRLLPHLVVHILFTYPGQPVHVPPGNHVNTYAILHQPLTPLFKLYTYFQTYVPPFLTGSLGWVLTPGSLRPTPHSHPLRPAMPPRFSAKSATHLFHGNNGNNVYSLLQAQIHRSRLTSITYLFTST